MLLETTSSCLTRGGLPWIPTGEATAHGTPPTVSVRSFLARPLYEYSRPTSTVRTEQALGGKFSVKKVYSTVLPMHMTLSRRVTHSRTQTPPHTYLEPRSPTRRALVGLLPLSIGPPYLRESIFFFCSSVFFSRVPLCRPCCVGCAGCS